MFMYKIIFIFNKMSFQESQIKHLSGPWISITPALHKLLAHSWELMLNNKETGLGSLDESGLEGKQ